MELRRTRPMAVRRRWSWKRKRRRGKRWSRPLRRGQGLLRRRTATAMGLLLRCAATRWRHAGFKPPPCSLNAIVTDMRQPLFFAPSIPIGSSGQAGGGGGGARGQKQGSENAAQRASGACGEGHQRTTPLSHLDQHLQALAQPPPPAPLPSFSPPGHGARAQAGQGGV